jgi:hypothetical protein
MAAGTTRAVGTRPHRCDGHGNDTGHRNEDHTDAMATEMTQATGTKTTQMRWQHRAGAIVEDTYRYCRQSRRRFARPLWPRGCCWPPWPWWWWRRLQTCISVIALQPAPINSTNHWMQPPLHDASSPCGPFFWPFGHRSCPHGFHPGCCWCCCAIFHQFRTAYEDRTHTLLLGTAAPIRDTRRSWQSSVLCPYRWWNSQYYRYISLRQHRIVKAWINWAE